MTREQAKEQLLTREPDFLTEAKVKVNGRKTYVCPKCGNGSGKDGDGIATKDGRHYKCFKMGCDFYGDIIELWKAHTGITDDREAFNGLYSYYGIEIDESSEPKAKQASTPERAKEKPAPDYTGYYRKCAERFPGSPAAAYLEQRGISEATAERFMLGYEPGFRASDGSIWDALIIPTAPGSYVARNIAPKSECRYEKSRGNSNLFNGKALNEADQNIAIVEGEIDALSVIEAGGAAIGLGGASGKNKLLDTLEQIRPKKPLVLALDNDEPGREATEQLAENLKARQISFYRLNLYGDHKDANEALLADRETFTKAVHDIADMEKTLYARESTAFYLRSFLPEVMESKNAPCYPTGFSQLDAILDGGFYAGVYTMGAVSSLGKTTLALQWADNIAKQGQDVLIFSLEMGRKELTAKSVSRLTYEIATRRGIPTRNAKSTRGIMTGRLYDNYSETERNLIADAIEEYGKYSGHIYIVEGIGDVKAATIRERVQRHIDITGNAPVILIDYLQILAPVDDHYSDKQNVDRNVLALKRLSRDFNIPVIGISSFNRENYNAPVNLTSFKESGAVEYSSDCLIGLQLSGMDYREGETAFNREIRIRQLQAQALEAGKKGNAQDLHLKVLKNRNGTKGDVYLAFYPVFNFYRQTTAPKLELITPENTETGGNWRTVQATAPRSKREKERESLDLAFIATQNDDIEASLTALADYMDKSKRQVTNLIKEYGGYSITGDTVTREADKKEFAELPPETPTPFDEDTAAPAEQTAETET